MEARLRAVEREVAVIKTDMKYLKEQGDKQEETLEKIEVKLGEVNDFVISSKTGGALFKLFFLACSAMLGGLATKGFDMLPFKD